MTSLTSPGSCNPCDVSWCWFMWDCNRESGWTMGGRIRIISSQFSNPGSRRHRKFCDGRHPPENFCRNFLFYTCPRAPIYKLIGCLSFSRSFFLFFALIWEECHWMLRRMVLIFPPTNFFLRMLMGSAVEVNEVVSSAKDEPAVNEEGQVEKGSSST